MPDLPLPFRGGIAPLRHRLPHPARPGTALEYLCAEFPDDDWLTAMLDSEVVDENGRPWTVESGYAAGKFVYFYRTPAPEVPVPFDMTVLHVDPRIIVVHKPHFLATIPRGRHITETATVRLRRQFDNPHITPAHRLDRLTAGVLMFTVDPAARRPYQDLFAEKKVTKVYEALAGYDSALQFPRTVRSRIVKEHGVMTATEEPGEPNSETHIELLERRGKHALYRLRPVTGKTHQLRIHLSSLGIPIVGDPYYPTFRSVPADDFSDPLQLLARSLEFTDPFTGDPRGFATRARFCTP